MLKVYIRLRYLKPTHLLKQSEKYHLLKTVIQTQLYVFLIFDHSRV